MSMHLIVTVGPFARFTYQGRRPDVASLTGERMREANSEGAKRGELCVMSNLRSDHVHRFSSYDEASVVPLDKSARVDATAWFASEFARDLDAIEAATGSAMSVSWGIVAEYM